MPAGIMLSHGLGDLGDIDLAAGFAVLCFVRYAHSAEHRENCSQHTNRKLKLFD
jgi:hypothetical protein